MLLSRDSASLKLNVVRDALSSSITVPETVLKWFVDVVDEASGLKASDWWDYVGFDRRPLDQLDQEMAADIRKFVDQLLTRKLRFVPRERSGATTLEWLVEDKWTQAVPFSADAD